MKFANSLKQKTQIAVLLFFIMICTLLIRVLEDRSIKEMEKSFASLYNDRLIPPTDLFYLLENFTSKKDIITNHIDAGFPKESIIDIKSALKVHDLKIDSLLTKYQLTYLAADEKGYFVELRDAISTTKFAEHNMIETGTPSNANWLSLKESYATVFSKLSALTAIKTTIGEELSNDSRVIVSGSNSYSSLQFALAIIIGVLIVSIMFASNVLKVKQEKFNLN